MREYHRQTCPYHNTKSLESTACDVKVPVKIYPIHINEWQSRCSSNHQIRFVLIASRCQPVPCNWFCQKRFHQVIQTLFHHRFGFISTKLDSVVFLGCSSSLSLLHDHVFLVSSHIICTDARTVTVSFFSSLVTIFLLLFFHILLHFPFCLPNLPSKFSGAFFDEMHLFCCSGLSWWSIVDVTHWNR